MGILNSTRKLLNQINEKSYRVGQLFGEIKKISNPDKRSLIDGVVLTTKEEQEIEAFYKQHYGKRIPLKWHRLYQSYTGNFQVDYFPEYLFSSKLEPMLDVNPYNDALEDKNLLHIYDCEDVYIPQTFFSRCNGLYREKNNLITEKDFYYMISNMGRVIIKPTVETGSGKDVRVLDVFNGIDSITGESIKDIIFEYDKKDFIIQECIRNSECISKLYPYSVNTFRVMTYILEGNIYTCPLLLRLGRAGKMVDNAHAGGLFIGCNEKGVLREVAFNEKGERFYKHPDTKSVFSGYKIEMVPQIIDVCKKLHAITPQLGIISWDVALNENNKVTLLELNTRGGSSWLPQMANGKGLFGENTSKILNIMRDEK